MLHSRKKCQLRNLSQYQSAYKSRKITLTQYGIITYANLKKFRFDAGKRSVMSFGILFNFVGCQVGYHRRCRTCGSCGSRTLKIDKIAEMSKMGDNGVPMMTRGVHVNGNPYLIENSHVRKQQ